MSFSTHDRYALALGVAQDDADREQHEHLVYEGLDGLWRVVREGDEGELPVHLIDGLACRVVKPQEVR